MESDYGELGGKVGGEGEGGSASSTNSGTLASKLTVEMWGAPVWDESGVVAWEGLEGTAALCRPSQFQSGELGDDRSPSCKGCGRPLP